MKLLNYISSSALLEQEENMGRIRRSLTAPKFSTLIKRVTRENDGTQRYTSQDLKDLGIQFTDECISVYLNLNAETVLSRLHSEKLPENWGKPMRKSVDINLNEIIRHNHPMAGKRSMNDIWAQRAIAGGYRYTCLVNDANSKGGTAGHPGYAMIFKTSTKIEMGQ